jgi:hypothetical protein
MKPAAQWVAEKIGERPEDFTPEEHPEITAWVESIQKDARPVVDRQKVVEQIALAFVFGATREAVQHAADAVMKLINAEAT